MVAALTSEGVLEAALGSLGSLLPATWTLRLQSEQPGDTLTPVHPHTTFGALAEVQDPHGSNGRLLIEAKARITPRDVESRVTVQAQLVRRLDQHVNLVVVAPWLSPRTRALLDEQQISFLDLSGNAHLIMERPAVVVRTDGASIDPTPAQRTGELSLRGAAAARVVRVLVDVRPPFTASLIARAAGVSIPYVSRLLTALDREALITRSSRGLVTDVSWPELLRRRAETYDVFTSHTVEGYLAGTGARNALTALRDGQVDYLAVTGSFAAALLAPVAAPTQLLAYTATPAGTRNGRHNTGRHEQGGHDQGGHTGGSAGRATTAHPDGATGAPGEVLGWLPTDRSADVVLLSGDDTDATVRGTVVDGLRIAAPSQLALDCLSGNGRMPAQGEAVLDWMRDNEPAWRTHDIHALPPRAPRD